MQLALHALSVATLGVVLAVTLPSFFGYHSLTVVSGSMGDALPIGSIAVTKPVAADAIRVGDVITFSRPGASLPVLHRVVSITHDGGQRVAMTKGDANGSEDALPLVLLGTGEVVQYHVPLLGYVLVFIQSLWGRLLVGILVGGSIVRALMRNRGSDANAHQAPA